MRLTVLVVDPCDGELEAYVPAGDVAFVGRYAEEVALRVHHERRDQT